MAVYTEVGDEELSSFLTDYDIGHLVAFRGIAEGVENSNFLLRTEKDGVARDFILTLYERRVNPAELPWFLGLMEHLATHGVSCPLPVAGRDGNALRELAGRPAAITTFLPGVWPRHVQVEHCGPLGEALARLHEAGTTYAPTRANGLGPTAWQPLLDKAAASQGTEETFPGLTAELRLALKRILSAWPPSSDPAVLPRGQIHADLFPDNAFFLDGRVSGIIDFYFACTDLLAYDVAICLNAWCFDETGHFDTARRDALLAGYESVRPLTSAEHDALPALCAGGALRFALTRLYDWVNTPAGALVTRKDPMDYVKKLRVFLSDMSVNPVHV
ncbi:homoserine kinase [Acetobacter estunensis NRIC 0472]|uniref:Homoserine kinase n=1 Tax=Acetobacter estunensis TaxID=104097 RepID=A0A967B5J8_9PROT|nr:homoserine kinase [Acetobacter estunensis]NHO52819.1 homoserine kinase [Acetobacter estunensis]GBQ28313.1 homoserine kinase [Acetobacter estunensis NRIC 0472]